MYRDLNRLTATNRLRGFEFGQTRSPVAMLTAETSLTHHGLVRTTAVSRGFPLVLMMSGISLDGYRGATRCHTEA